MRFLPLKRPQGNCVVLVSTGRSTLQKRVMALLRRIEHPTPGNIEVTFSSVLCLFILRHVASKLVFSVVNIEYLVEFSGKTETVPENLKSLFADAFLFASM